jgi:hypothetical protein
MEHLVQNIEGSTTLDPKQRAYQDAATFLAAMDTLK